MATNLPREIDGKPINSQETESQASLDSVYRRYGERILNLAYRMTSDEETARDLTHDVFLKVHESMDRFEGDSHIYTWIYRIAVNHILNHLRRARRAKWIRLLDENVADLVKQDKPVVNGDVGDSEDIVQAIEHHERSKVLWSAVQSLPPKFRMPLVLFFYEDLTHQEIAEVMNLSLSAVETRIHRAKKALFGKIQPYLSDL
ncbi:MAG: sigma-70 family RNA polymerase sigma factor [Bacteroidetes bacterium]|nr:sigma-70 family RNA polymerase sigma factor [Bacteroidota bacterium]